MNQKPLDSIVYDDVKAWAYLARILTRPWFDRLWIIQEITAAKKAVAVVGLQKVPWGNLVVVALELFTLHTTSFRSGTAYGTGAQKILMMMWPEKVLNIVSFRALNDLFHILSVTGNSQTRTRG